MKSTILIYIFLFIGATIYFVCGDEPFAASGIGVISLTMMLEKLVEIYQSYSKVNGEER